MPAASPLKTSNAQIDSAEDDAVLPTPDPSAGPKVSLPTGAALGGDSDSEPVRPSQSVRKHQSRRRMNQQRLDFAPSSPIKQTHAATNLSQPVRARKQKPVGFFGTQKQIVIDDDSSEGNNSVVELSPPPKETSRSQRQTRSMQQTSSPSSPRATQIAQLPTERRASAEDRFTDFGQQDDSDDLPTTPAITRRKGSKNTGTAEQRSSPFIVEDDDDESDDIQVVSSRRRRSPKKRSRREDRESSGDEVITSSPRKKLRRGRDRRSSLSKEEQQELKDEIQDLASSGSDDEVKIRQSQRKLSSQKTAREMALERLKQKRAGALPVVEEDEELDSEDEQDVDQLEDEDEDEDDEVARVPYSSTRDMFARDEDDEGFVLEDEDGPSGVPQGLPLAFTRFASMKAKDLFKYAVEWMVQKKINPAFQIDDEVYDLAFKKLDDEVAGLAGSKFRSSAWTQDFALALQARPQIAFAPINRKSAEHFMRDKCDACNRSGHPATYEIQFQGKPYHRLTLEDVANGDDDEDFDSDESGSNHQNHGPDRDAKGRIILPEHTIFYVGKFCKGNAETAHALEHWRYHLYEWVVDWLQSAGYNTPEKIVERDKWSTRKRRKYANKIVDAMEQQGKTKALYHDFKNELDRARHSKQGRWHSSP